VPLVTLETRRWMTPAQKKLAFEAVHAALVSAFKIPDHDRHQRLLEYAGEDFEIPPGKGERYLAIALDVFAGRSLDAKRALYKEIVERLEAAVGIPPADVLISLREIPLENWGVRGGQAACDVDLGFQVRV
jgi:phenylpyruvate tautomerase PptA (4-oxalocrotonate tautomerase family)